MSRKATEASTPHRFASKRAVRCALVAAVIPLFSLSLAHSALAAATNPAEGTVSLDNPSLSFNGGPDVVSNPTPDPLGQTGGPVCDEVPGAPPCDHFLLNVQLPADYATTNPHALITITLGWNGSDDYDLYAYNSDGSLHSSSASGNNPEVIRTAACGGSYSLDLTVVPYTATGDAYIGSVTLNPDAGNLVNCNGLPPAPGATGPGVPRFQNYPAPAMFNGFENEPSLGVDWASGKILFANIGIRPVGSLVGLAKPDTLRLSLDPSTSPSRAIWKSVGYVTTSQFGLDPILFTDSNTNRTFVSELAGACSAFAFTDDDGESWTPGQGCGAPAGTDHETVGGGAYSGSLLPLGTQTQGVYPDSVYYCSQDIFTAFCARSDDGGLTFGPGVPIYLGSAGLLAVSDYNLMQCQGLHGHLKVGPKGTVYVPNADCGGHPAVAVSEDNGVTWNVRADFAAPSPSFSGSDPSVGTDASGTLYLCYQGADAHIHVAVSPDHGLTWSSDRDVSGAVGVVNTVFPTAVAGDTGRAACAFLGSTTPGDYQAPSFSGLWQLYVAYTYDGGTSWQVVDATPDDPVQGPGGVCTGGTSCSGNNRNLLDFIDSHLDSHGNVVVGYADGCIGACSHGGANAFDSLPTVAYQSGGKPLFARYDPVEPASPRAPLLVSATQTSDGRVALSWRSPDNGGSGITGYDVYRGTSSGTETLLAKLSGSRTAFTDTSALAPSTGAEYFYQVAAENAVGAGERGNELEASAPVAPPSPCTVPGPTVVTDAIGDQLGAPADNQLDVESISMAEPYYPDGARKLVVTLRVEDLSTVPANSYWKVYFNVPDGRTYFVDMNTTSAGGAPQFEYGRRVTSSTGVDDVVDGTLDPTSGYSTDGQVTLIAADSAVGGLQAGDVLSSIRGETQVLGGANGSGALETADSAGTGSYTLIGNSACKPNEPPVASLAADPVSGASPLTVRFDGSASYDPDGDGVTQYAFTFGDGSAPVTQTTPSVQHTYRGSGSYQAALTVVDGKGRASDNTASVRISVDPAPAGSDEIRGSGTIPVDTLGGTGRFDLDATSENSGRFRWSDRVHGVVFKSDALNGFSRSGNCVSFAGSGTLVNGSTVDFEVTGCDNGAPHSGLDTFTIKLSGATFGNYAGTLERGDLVIFTRGERPAGDGD